MKPNCPTSIFLHAPFTDALFLSVSIGSILMMVRKKPILAGLFACAAGITRAQGILIMIPMVIFHIQGYYKNRKSLTWIDLLGLFIAPLGFFGYSFWRMQNGIGNLFKTYQSHSNAGFRFPFTNIYLGIKGIFDRPTLLEISEVTSIIFFLVILLWMCTQYKFRKHPAILIYSLTTWILIASKTTYWASPLQSANRYVLHLYFAFVGLTSIILNLSWKKQKLIIFLSLATCIIISCFYTLWFFIG